MFTNAINELPLTDKLASELFTNVNADSFDGDATFCATLRFLLFDKLQPCESVNVKLSIDKNTREGFIIPVPFSKNTLYICVMKGHSAESFEQARLDYKRKNDAFVYQEQASRYLTEAGYKSHVYIDEEARITLVFTLNMTMKYWHKMQSSLTRLLPWYFPAPIDDSDRDFLHTLTNKDSSKYMEYITAYAKKFNFHEDRLKRMLKDFGLSYEKLRLETLKNDRISNNNVYNRAQEDIKRSIAKERELQTAIMGIEELLARGDGTGLSDYFICNKFIHLVGVEYEVMSYIVTTYLDYFDQQVFERFMKNPRSYFYEKQDGVAKNQSAYIKLLNALFGDAPVLKIRVCAEFTMSLSGTLNGIGDSKRLTNYPDWLPHPHIDSTHCLGTNQHHINDMMLAKRYIEAIEQTIAAVKNINFADSVVAKKLVTKIQTSSQRFIELPTGEVVAPADAVSWLEKQVL